jgi:hypothetical protein
MNSFVSVLLWSGLCGVVASVVGAVVAVFGKRNEERLKVGNASGIGFLVGASVGALIGIFESFLGRL